MRRLINLPLALAFVLMMLGLGMAGAVGVIVGVRAQESGISRKLQFITDSRLATNIVDPLLHSAKAMAVDHENVDRKSVV